MNRFTFLFTLIDDHLTWNAFPHYLMKVKDSKMLAI